MLGYCGNKCFFCCCLSKDVSAKVCTYLMQILQVIAFIYTLVSIGWNWSLILYILYSIPLISLLIGLQKYKRKWIKFFGIYGIILMVNVVVLIFAFIKVFSLYYHADEVAHEYMSDPKYQNEYPSFTEEELAEAITNVANFYIVCQIIGFMINLHYFLTTYSYTQLVLKTMDEENEARDTENGKP